MIKTTNRWIHAEPYCKANGLDFDTFLKQPLTVKLIDKLILTNSAARRQDFVDKGKIAWQLSPLFASFAGLKDLNKKTQPKIGLSLDDYMQEPVQLSLASKINRAKIKSGGLRAALRYNRRNCKNATGFRPRDIRLIAADKDDVGSVQKNSAKAFIRAKRPHLAAVMAAADDFSLQGFNEPTAMEMAKNMEPYFARKYARKLQQDD